MSNVFRFTVELDNDAWESADDDARAKWIDEIYVAISDQAYVSSIEQL